MVAVNRVVGSRERVGHHPHVSRTAALLSPLEIFENCAQKGRRLDPSDGAMIKRDGERECRVGDRLPAIQYDR
jgi:hypothetical protein